MIWKILGIEATKDEERIRSAYRERLKNVNPEDDQEGFKELRRAYEEALEYAGQEETEIQEEIPEDQKTDVDRWLDRIEVLYRDVKTRRDPSKWKTLLEDPVCEDLDTELEAGERLLVFLMSHSYMPQEAWKQIDRRFGYLDNLKQLKERFPENFLDYVRWQIENPSFIDFDLFDGRTDANADEYINKLYDVKNAVEEGNLAEAERMFRELSRFEISHPFAEVERARFLLKNDQGQGGEEAGEALRIMEDLDFEYADQPYVERVYAQSLIANGQVGKAKEIYEGVLENSPENYGALLGKANCIFLLGKGEEAKELVEDILEERVQDTDSLELLDKINEELVTRYLEELQKGQDRETVFKLGWCYYQQKKFEEGLALLDTLEKAEDYDYVNLKCRLYLASEKYDEAKPYAMKWVQMIEETEEDGSKEMQKRRNRLSLAHFSVGICMWETSFKHASGAQRQQSFVEAVAYIERAIDEEHNALVRFSYMEQLARFYLENQDYQECIRLCSEIIQKDPGFFPAYVHRQKANYELRNAKEVLDDYYACLELYPGFAPVYELAAEVYFAFDQYEDVEEVLEAAEKDQAESDALELMRIKCLHYKDFSKEHVEEALRAFDVLYEKIRQRAWETTLEDLSDLYKEHAILYWDLDQTDRALTIIEDGIKMCRDGALSLQYLKIDVLSREKRYDEALSVCRELLEDDPDNLVARVKLGACYERMDQEEDAISCYRKILSVDPNHVQAVRRLMYLYSYLSDREDDLDLCRKGIFYATKLIGLTGSAEGYIERGNLHIDLYELEKAVDDCRKAIELDPEAYYAYNNLGCALLKLRKIDEAMEPLLQVVAMDPDRDHMPWLNLAECYSLKKDYDQAIHAYKEVLRLKPKAVRFKKEIALLWIKKGEYDRAIAFFQNQAREIEKRIAEMPLPKRLKYYSGVGRDEEKEKLLLLYYDIADACRQAGYKNKAREYYKRVENGPAALFQYVSCAAYGKLAAYYRDIGESAYALRLVRKALSVKDPELREGYDFAYLYYVGASVCFELGQSEQAGVYAGLFLEDQIGQKGGEKKVLNDRRYRQMYLYDIAVMSLCAGDFRKAEESLNQMRDCKLCVTCEKWGCYEYYFGMGLLEEVRGGKDKARELYEKALELEPDCTYARYHLEKL